MSSEDPDRFERNIKELIRHGALPLDHARAARARGDFLRGVQARPGASSDSRSWNLSSAAALLLICVTIFWAMRTERSGMAPPGPSPRNPKTPTAALSLNPGTGGNETLQGTLKMPRDASRGDRVGFCGRSTLPDGLIFNVRVEMMQEQYARGRLERIVRENNRGGPALENGAFEHEWNSTGPRCLRVAVSAPDGLQTLDMVKTLKIKDDERRWSFEFYAWDNRLVPRLGSELLEIAGFVRDARELVSKFSSACVSEAAFKERKGELEAQAKKLRSRVETRAEATLFPAALGEIAYTLRDLTTSIESFRWEDGKFAGPISYYANHKRGNTFRQEPFTFEALERYLEETITIGGREFDLWIVNDIRRAGPRPVHAGALKEQAHHPGVVEFAGRLQNPAGEDLDHLEQDIRALGSVKER